MAWEDFKRRLTFAMSEATFRKAVNEAVKADGDATEELAGLLAARPRVAKVLNQRPAGELFPVMCVPPGAVMVRNGPEVPPLLVAAMNHKPGRSKVLIDYGADVEIAGSDGRTPLHLALAGHPDCLMQAIQQSEVFHRTGSAEGIVAASPAVDAQTQAASLETLRILLDAGANPNYRNAFMSTPIRVAAMHCGKSDHISLLLDRGAEIDARSASDFTALMVAAGYGNTEVVRLLLSRGANAELRNSAGLTAVDAACMNGHAQTLNALLDAGADPGSRDSRGGTPLHRACGRGLEEIVRILIERGASANAADDYGNTSIDAIGPSNPEPVRNLLIAAGGKAAEHRLLPQAPLSYQPLIQGAKAVDVVKMGPYACCRLADFQSMGRVRYTHVMALLHANTGMPCLYVTAERDGLGPLIGKGSHFLGLFDHSGHHNFGSEDDWEDPAVFQRAALRVIRERVVCPPDRQ